MENNVQNNLYDQMNESNTHRLLYATFLKDKCV